MIHSVVPIGAGILRLILPIILAMLATPSLAQDVHIPANASPEVRKALEDHNRMRKTPFLQTLNKAAEIERQDPSEAERLIKQAFELAGDSSIPTATSMCHFQLALFYYRQKRTKEADAELLKYQDSFIEKWSTGNLVNKLADLEAFGEAIKISADLHQYSGYSDVAERLLTKRLEYFKHVRPKLPEVDDVLFEDRIERQAWLDLHTCYFKQGREDLAAKIWKKYPSLEAEYKRMKEQGLRTGRYSGPGGL